MFFEISRERGSHALSVNDMGHDIADVCNVHVSIGLNDDNLIT